MLRHLFPYFFVTGALAQAEPDSLVALSLSREDSSLALIQRLPFNTSHSEYSPFVHRDRIYFITDRPNRTGVQFADAQNNTGITDIFYAETGDIKKISPARSMNEVNTKYYEGPLCFSPSGDTMYFTGNDGKTKNLRIMMSSRKGSRWSKPAPLSFCTDSFSFCHPSLSADGRTLYFSGNYRTAGDMDLFYSAWQDSSWSRPVNAGKALNTPFNELFPYAGRPDHLYFSSNRPGGLGGLDLYLYTPNNEVSQLLYPPLNSPEDDFGVYVGPDGTRGYLSSNRLKNRKDDIFSFERSVPDFSNCGPPPERTRFCYTFYEESSVRDQDTASIQYQWRFGDGAADHGLRARHCYSAPGNYTVELVVLEKSSGNIEKTILDYQIHIPQPEKVQIVSPDSVLVNEIVVCDATASALKDHDINAMYWSFGDGFYNKGPLVGHRYRTVGKFVLELWVSATHRPTHEQKKFRLTKEIEVRALN